MSLKLKPSQPATLDLPSHRAAKARSSATSGVCESSWRRRPDGSLSLKWRPSVHTDRAVLKG